MYLIVSQFLFKFYLLITEVITSEYHKMNRTITDKIYYTTIGTILNNAKDWDGHRLLRMNLQSKIVENENVELKEYYVDENNTLQEVEEFENVIEEASSTKDNTA